MGLKLSDALRLSWGNIAQHKKRSAVIILTVSVLFGVVMGFSFMIQGLRSTILNAALQANDGKVYLDINYQKIADFGHGGVKKVDNKERLNEFIKEEVARHHGKIIGEKTRYQFIDILETITPEVAKRISGEIDLFNKPKDKVAALMPAKEDQYNIDNSNEYYIVGTYPATKQGNPTLPGLNPANLLLGKVYGSEIEAKMPLIIDDGSEAVRKHFIKNAQQKINSGSPYKTAEEFLEAQAPQIHYIAEFPSYADAINYYNDSYAGKNIPKNAEIGEDKYEIVNMDTFGRVIYIGHDFDNLQSTLDLIERIFIIVAVLIAVFTFAHLIDNDAATVALYRSLGASTGNIFLIYFLYLIKLCLLATMFSALIALIIGGVIGVSSAGALAERLKDFYMLKDLPKVNFFGLNTAIFGVAGSILMVAPLSLLFTLRRFSAAHIAKKLKED